MEGQGNSRARARALVEGALLAALAAVLVWVVAYLPLGAYLFFLMPTPVTVAVVRHGLRTGALTAATAALLLLALLGPLPAVGAAVTLAGIGLPMGWGVRRAWPAGATVAATAAGFLVVAAAALGLGLLVTGVNPLAEMLRLFEESGQWARGVARRLGLPGEAVEQQAQLWELVVQTMRLVLPAALVVGALAWSLLGYLGSAAVLSRLGHPAPPLPPFARWRVPAWAAWGFVALQLLLFALRGQLEGTLAERVALNAFFALMVVFTVNGLATAYFFLARWGVRRGVAVALLAAAAVWFSALLLWLGLLEPILRLRDWAEARGGAGAAGPAGDRGGAD